MTKHNSQIRTAIYNFTHKSKGMYYLCVSEQISALNLFPWER